MGEAWVQVARGEHEEAGNLADITCDFAASRVAGRLGMALADAMDHVQLSCSRIRFFEAPLFSTCRDG